MPFKLMEKEGLLEKRANELGVKIELVEFKGYMDSVQAFASKKVDACAMTSMEALQPASSGVPTVAILVNDISNGGDGVLVREGMTIADLKGTGNSARAVFCFPTTSSTGHFLKTESTKAK